MIFNDSQRKCSLDEVNFHPPAEGGDFKKGHDNPAQLFKIDNPPEDINSQILRRFRGQSGIPRKTEVCACRLRVGGAGRWVLERAGGAAAGGGCARNIRTHIMENHRPG